MEAGVWTSLDHSWSLCRRSLLLHMPCTMVSLLSSYGVYIKLECIINNFTRIHPHSWHTHTHTSTHIHTHTNTSTHTGKGRKDSQLNPDQREQKLVSCPSLLEYFGYTLNFHTLLAGPACTFREYTAFVNGSNFNTAKDCDDGKVRSLHTPHTHYYYVCVCVLF